MGAGTGNRNNMDAARRQQAMEGQAMRRRALEQQDLNLLQMKSRWYFNMSTPQMSASPVAIPQPSMGRSPEIRSGINFGPGRPTESQNKVVPSMNNFCNVFVVLVKCGDE
jgi:hypothetical protein